MRRWGIALGLLCASAIAPGPDPSGGHLLGETSAKAQRRPQTGAWWQSLVDPRRRLSEQGWQAGRPDDFWGHELRARALPEHQGIVHRLVLSWARRGHRERDNPTELGHAIAEVETLRQRLPDDERGSATFSLAVLRSLRGDFEEAVALYEELLPQLGPRGQSRVLANIGEVRMRQGRLLEAASAFRDATDRASGSDRFWPLFSQAVCRDRLGDGEGARGLAQEALAVMAPRSDPFRGVVFDPPEEEFYYRGLYFLAKASRREAAQDASEARSLEGDRVSSRNHWNRFLAAAPDSPFRAQAIAHRERLRRAIIEGRRAPWVTFRPSR